MTPVEVQAIRELNQSVRGLAALLAVQVRAAKMQLPQWYTLADLQERWALSEAEVSRLMRDHANYTGRRGVSPRFHLDDVLRVDEALTRGKV